MIPDFKNMTEDDLWEITEAYDNKIILVDAIETIKENLTKMQKEVLGIEEEDNTPDPEVVAKMERKAEVARRVMMRGSDLIME